MPENYHPEPYWSEVAQRIASRAGKNVIAGDDEPFYRYKREKFLKLLRSVDFAGKNVLEVGPGPGGNLRVVADEAPATLTGADISSEMLKLASENLDGLNVELVKVDGTTLPFATRQFDIVFTATVLQHNTDDEMMRGLLAEICRVSDKHVVLFERVEKTIKGDALCLGRPVDYYAELCRKHGFELDHVDFLAIEASYLMSGIVRKGLNSAGRKEGEPLNRASYYLQKMLLPVTRVIDGVVGSKRELAKMVFRRKD